MDMRNKVCRFDGTVVCIEGGWVLEGETTRYGGTAIAIRAACGGCSGCGGRGLRWL